MTTAMDRGAVNPTSATPKLSITRALADNTWLPFVGRRLVGLAIVLSCLVAFTFMLVRWVPGDPAQLIGGITATPEQVQQIRSQLGLDKPLVEQFTIFWEDLAKGDLGESFLERGTPVTLIIEQRVGSSFQLATAALLLVMVVSVPLGIWSALLTQNGRHRRFEFAFTTVTSIVGSVPEFLTATFLVFLFAVTIPIFPVAGEEGWQSLVLPSAALALRPIAILARLVRVETLNVLVQDYIRTARSKRLPTHVLIVRHVLPNVLTAALTIGGLLFAGLIAGAVIIETIFARAGLGSQLVTAVLSHDYPVIQGVVLVLGATVVVVNALVDMLLGILNPRSLTKQA